MRLIIVESPTKSKTLKKFLGKNYQIVATMGHIRDLPQKEFGIDIGQNFKPKYVIPLQSKKTIQSLKKNIQKAQSIILAVDPDREGEAIAWHLIQALQLGKFQAPNSKSQTPKSKWTGQANSKYYQRIVFHEITKSAIEKALKNPKKIDMNLVNAQQARRILDRIVGYKLSPFLWKKLIRGLSAGRVQSVAVRLIVDREKEIQDFKAQEYWSIEALLQKNQKSKIKNQNYNSKVKIDFKALLVKKNEKIIPKLGIKNKDETEEIVKNLEGAEYKIINIEKKEIKRNPLPPFTTSTLQQEAWKKFRWTAKNTMRIAQQLYEKGLTTYHRTDSLNLSDQSLLSAKKFIINNYGKNYWPGFLKKYKTKSKSAQEAHEAIRPTYPNKAPQLIKTDIDNNQYRLYSLIWQRFIACQMKEALFDSTRIKISATPKDPAPRLGAGPTGQENYIFQANGQTLKFDGFLKIYSVRYEENELPILKKEEILKLLKLIPSQHFTEPPARYTEAILIKTLEKNGIGRPSTYAPTISLIQERNYVQKNEQKRFQPTEIGTLLGNFLIDHFPKIVDVSFTAQMEEDLDKIAAAKTQWTSVVNNFYNPFMKNLEQKEKEINKKDLTEEKTNEKCEKCGSEMIIKLGRFGKFMACNNYPECKNTKPIGKEEKEMKQELSNEICNKCNAKMMIKRGKFGTFLGCSQYPECKNTKPIEKSTGVDCPECSQGKIIERKTKRNKIFYSCNKYPECNFALWEKPSGEKCVKCQSLLVKTRQDQTKCSNKECTP